MKKFFYSLYAFIFNLCRIFPIKHNRVAFISPHNADESDNLGAVKAQVESLQTYECFTISRKDLMDKSDGVLKALWRSLIFFTLKAYKLATSKYVFLNDNFMPLGKLNFKQEVVVTQLWHAQGAFKKFGVDVENVNEEIRTLERKGNSKLSYVVCSSKDIVPIYAKAFEIDEKKVLPLGSARSDYFFKNKNVNELRLKLDERYPQIKGKKLILYAPTFRDNELKDKELLNHFDTEKFNQRFGDKYALLIRLHPQIHRSKLESHGAINVTDYPSINELILMCDKLITDYSSICMDFIMLSKPVYFYSFDLESYNNERSFYFDYESYIPSPAIKTFDELIENIDSYVFDDELVESFKQFNIGNPDGATAKKIVEEILLKSEEKMQ